MLGLAWPASVRVWLLVCVINAGLISSFSPSHFLWAYFALILFFWAYFCSQVGTHDSALFYKCERWATHFPLACCLVCAPHVSIWNPFVFKFKYFLVSAVTIPTVDALKEHCGTHKRTEASPVIFARDAVRGAVGGRELTPRPWGPTVREARPGASVRDTAPVCLLCSVFLALPPALCQRPSSAAPMTTAFSVFACLLSRSCCDCHCPWAQPFMSVTPFSPHRALCGTILHVTARTWRPPHSRSCGAR